ncbi:hypothetical protein CBOM_02751 [Ceraceosorus bombacis]|uniref:Uncharacterized protein n=1 Tax=Ceraceosorus bombacis TaxID=401625 RepID=A0A0P1BG03_9BASI|nr:hypothetical protein CBOM_02751 [Ceraceosorus bombacis]
MAAGRSAGLDAEATDPLLDAVQRVTTAMRTYMSLMPPREPPTAWQSDPSTLHDFLFQLELIFQRDGIDDDTRRIAYALSRTSGPARDTAFQALANCGSYSVGQTASEVTPEWLKTWDAFAGRLCIDFGPR